MQARALHRESGNAMACRNEGEEHGFRPAIGHLKAPGPAIEARVGREEGAGLCRPVTRHVLRLHRQEAARLVHCAFKAALPARNHRDAFAQPLRMAHDMG